jgi:hypothetical protein
VGLVSGLIIPAPTVVVLDLGLLFLGLWDVYNDVTRLGAPDGRSVWAALGMTLVVNLPNILRHLWGIRWAFLVTGALGVLAALAHRAASRIPRGWGRGMSFLAIFAALSLSLNGFLLIGREWQARLMAVDRVIYFLRQLRGESYDTDLVTGTAIALAVGLVFWEVWRTLYRGVGVRVGLPQTQEVRLRHQTHASGAGGMAPELEGEFDPRGAAWVSGLLMLCFVVWLPLDWAYARHVPRTISGSVYLQPSAPERVDRVVLGASPHEIVFSSSVGHGLFDAVLVRRPGAPTPIREVRDFQLAETPEGSYSYAHMSVEGLDPGEYFLRMSLRPVGELSPEAFAIMGDGEGVVNHSLYQGGGISYWLIAAGMSTFLTVGLLGVVALLIQGAVYLRAR